MNSDPTIPHLIMNIELECMSPIQAEAQILRRNQIQYAIQRLEYLKEQLDDLVGKRIANLAKIKQDLLDSISSAFDFEAKAINSALADGIQLAD